MHTHAVSDSEADGAHLGQGADGRRRKRRRGVPGAFDDSSVSLSLPLPSVLAGRALAVRRFAYGERERERERVVMDASLALGRVRARQDPWAQATWAQAYTCTGLGEGPAACARPRRAVHVGRLSKELAARCAVLCVAHEPQTRVEVSAEVSAERRQRRGAQHAVCPW